MKNRCTVLLVIGLLISFACLLVLIKSMVPSECPWKKSQRCETSFSRIASNPDRYLGRNIFTYGYVAVSDGNVYLYRNEAGYVEGEYFDRLFINLETIEKIADVERSLYTYTSISGVMYEDVRGKEGPAIGGLDGVILFEPDARAGEREGWDRVGIPVTRIDQNGDPK